LGDLYYEISKQPAYIKEYRIKDLQIIAECFEKSREVLMKDFVKAFNGQLSRGQIKYLILKLEDEKLIEKLGIGRTTVYLINKNIDTEQNITTQFVEHLSK